MAKVSNVTKARVLDEILDHLISTEVSLNWPAEKENFADWVDELLAETYYGGYRGKRAI